VQKDNIQRRMESCWLGLKKVTSNLELQVAEFITTAVSSSIV
jgi:hypothetical protein